MQIHSQRFWIIKSLVDLSLNFNEIHPHPTLVISCNFS